MIVRTCLLISDDPDDHIEFSEALYEISDDTVLVAVSDVRKALDLLRLKKCVPEFVFVHIGMTAFEPDAFFAALESHEHLRRLKVIAFGDGDQMFAVRFPAFINSDMSFSELKETLRSILA